MVEVGLIVAIIAIVIGLIGVGLGVFGLTKKPEIENFIKMDNSGNLVFIKPIIIPTGQKIKIGSWEILGLGESTTNPNNNNVLVFVDTKYDTPSKPSRISFYPNWIPQGGTGPGIYKDFRGKNPSMLVG